MLIAPFSISLIGFSHDKALCTAALHDFVVLFLNIRHAARIDGADGDAAAGAVEVPGGGEGYTSVNIGDGCQDAFSSGHIRQILVLPLQF